MQYIVPPLRLAVIQPILAPYRRPIWERIATCSEIKLKVFVLSGAFPHRRGWYVRSDEQFDVEIVGAFHQVVKGSTPAGITSTENTVYGIRPISPRLARRVALFRPDAVICTSVTEILSLLPLRVLHPCCMGAWVEDTQHTAMTLYRGWRRSFRAFIYRRLDFFISSGIESAEYLAKIGVPRNRITPGRASVDNDRYKLDRPHNKKGDKKKWIAVGRLIPRKGFSELLQAWSLQSREFHASNQLLIVGEGPEEKKLHQLIRQVPTNNVEVIGFQSPNRLASLYLASDVFVFPTLLDHWGLVVNEAMASGLPIVCSKYAGCCADLVTRSNGIVFDPLDPASFSKTIYDFWMLRDQWHNMAEASRSIISAYTVDATANAIINAIKKTVGSSQ